MDEGKDYSKECSMVKDLRCIAREIEALKILKTQWDGYDCIVSTLDMFRIYVELKDCYMCSFSPDNWTDDWGKLLRDCNYKLTWRIGSRWDIRTQYNIGYLLSQWEEGEEPFPYCFDEMESELTEVSRFLYKIDSEKWRDHAFSLNNEIHEDIQWMIDRVAVIRGDKEGITDDEEKALMDALGHIGKQIPDEFEKKYNRREREEKLLAKRGEEKSQTQILEEMREEARLDILGYETFKEIFLDYYNRENLFPIFRRLYMRSDWRPFLEACIKFKWCDDKIAELENEKKKQLLEQNKEFDEVRGYVDNLKGLKWKSPASKENITAFMEALYGEEKFISLIKDDAKKGVANIIGYLVGMGYLKSQPKSISKHIFEDDKQVDNINHGRKQDSISQEFRDLKETLDSFKDIYIEGVKG